MRKLDYVFMGSLQISVFAIKWKKEILFISIDQGQGSPKNGLQATSGPLEASFRPANVSHVLCFNPFQIAQGQKVGLHSPLFRKEDRIPLISLAGGLWASWRTAGWGRRSIFPFKICAGFKPAGGLLTLLVRVGRSDLCYILFLRWFVKFV